MEDIQERLVYRTHIYIKTEIRDYNPSSGDIAYPEKLETMEKIAAGIVADGVAKKEALKKSESDPSISNDVSPIAGDSTTFEFNNLFTKSNHISPADVHGMWFPTVRRTLICLSKLYRCVEVCSNFNYWALFSDIFCFLETNF